MAYLISVLSVSWTDERKLGIIPAALVAILKIWNASIWGRMLIVSDF